MDLKVFALSLTPFLWGLWRLIRREYAEAVGVFILAMILVPVGYWLRDVQPTRTTWYAVFAIWIILTIIEIWYIRKKAKSQKQ